MLMKPAVERCKGWNLFARGLANIMKKRPLSKFARSVGEIQQGEAKEVDFDKKVLAYRKARMRE